MTATLLYLGGGFVLLVLIWRAVTQISFQLETLTRVVGGIADLLREDGHGLRSIGSNVNDIARRARQEEHEEWRARHGL